MTTNGSGNASFNLNFATAERALRVTATATDPVGNTSEFSPAIGQLSNVSTRLRVQTGDSVLIGGFIITGNDPKRVIVRGLGPSLAAGGVQDALVDPTLELHDGNGALLESNDDWQSDHKAEIQQTGIPPSSPKEAAIVATLPPNAAYTAIVRGKDNSVGIGLVEAYDLNQAANSRLANISTRGLVETGDNVLIGGFIVGDGVAKVIVRALGPSPAGVNGALQDPTLELRDGSGAPLALNDDWQEAQKAEIESTGIPPSDPQESAIVASLPPGAYTAIVRGANGTTGVALVEVYNIQ